MELERNARRSLIRQQCAITAHFTHVCDFGPCETQTYALLAFYKTGCDFAVSAGHGETIVEGET